ncbi:unnamed protein product [Mytilus edulis]|uniref:F5/8 type C domain-containing protein n=1 Tax=Mytilus edulis TaxID=6550 RepID=A0A8S3PZ38_MYTED|nr:unnamed protein product [Mytilus edulis]
MKSSYVKGVLYIFTSCAFADVNIASKKPTKISSIYDPKVNEEGDILCCNSTYAVDGDKTSWKGEDLFCAHTRKDDTQQPWWAVDLLNVYDINVIDIYGRTDGNEYQLTNFDVKVFMPACTCNSWNNLDEGDVFHCHFQATKSQRITLTCPNTTRGRFVRIKRRDTEILTICEVEVYGDPVNNLIESGLSITAHACGYVGYGYVGPAIGTSVANSDIIHCTLICFTNTACNAAEYDKKTNVCTLKGDCTGGTQSSLFQDNDTNVFFYSIDNSIVDNP